MGTPEERGGHGEAQSRQRGCGAILRLRPAAAARCPRGAPCLQAPARHLQPPQGPSCRRILPQFWPADGRESCFQLLPTRNNDSQPEACGRDTGALSACFVQAGFFMVAKIWGLFSSQRVKLLKRWYNGTALAVSLPVEIKLYSKELPLSRLFFL